jgi:hypothetical protein
MVSDRRVSLNGSKRCRSILMKWASDNTGNSFQKTAASAAVQFYTFMPKNSSNAFQKTAASAAVQLLIQRSW